MKFFSLFLALCACNEPLIVDSNRVEAPIGANEEIFGTTPAEIAQRVAHNAVAITWRTNEHSSAEFTVNTSADQALLVTSNIDVDTLEIPAQLTFSTTDGLIQSYTFNGNIYVTEADPPAFSSIEGLLPANPARPTSIKEGEALLGHTVDFRWQTDTVEGSIMEDFEGEDSSNYWERCGTLLRLGDAFQDPC